jgi:DNA-binding MarR family transcriptional regulator
VSAASESSSPIDDVVDGVLQASRALVAVAARSLVDVEEAVTIPQFRALVVLGSRGPLGAGEVADALGVHISTFTRMGDRLISKELITRYQSPDNRRRQVIELTPRGRRLVRSVTRRRRQEITRIVEQMSAHERVNLVRALRGFSDAAGEPPDAMWSPEWFGE